MGEFLNAFSLIPGVVTAVGNVVDPYVLTEQEKLQNQLAGEMNATNQQAISANVAIAQAKEETNRQMITYGLAAVALGSAVYLGSRLIGK